MREAEFTALIQRHVALLHKVAGTYCRDAEDRRDIVQEIAAQLWQSRDRYDPARPASTWIYRVALNVAISFHRRERRHLRGRTDDVAPEIIDDRAAEPTADVERLRRCMDQLPELDRAPVLLWLEGHEYAEIAALLGLTTTNVATRLHRIRQKLRRCIETQATTTERENERHG